MNNSVVSGLKIAIIFILFTGFLFILVETRLESKEYDVKIRDIQREIENLNALKMELSLHIDSELQRLSSYDYSAIGKPITMRDVVIVPLDATALNEKRESKAAELNFIDKLILQLINSF